MTVVAEPVVFEAHISSLAAKDPRWRAVWSEFLSSCTLPDNGGLMAVGEPGGYAKCMEDPHLEAHEGQHDNWMGKVKKALSLRSSTTKGACGRSLGKFARKDCDQEVKIAELLGSILGGDKPKRRGNFYYPPLGYQSWHTSALDPPGWRLYIVHNVPSGCSLFRYRHPTGHQVQDCVDSDGTMRLYRITSKPKPVLWHCITSAGDRWSMGVQLCDEAAERLRELMNPVIPPPKQASTPRSVSFLFGSQRRRKPDSSRTKRVASDNGVFRADSHGSLDELESSSCHASTGAGSLRRQFRASLWPLSTSSGSSSQAVAPSDKDEEEKSNQMVSWIRRQGSWEEGKDSAWVRSGEHQSFDNEPDLMPFDEVTLSEASLS